MNIIFWYYILFCLLSEPTTCISLFFVPAMTDVLRDFPLSEISSLQYFLQQIISITYIPSSTRQTFQTQGIFSKFNAILSKSNTSHLEREREGQPEVFLSALPFSPDKKNAWSPTNILLTCAQHFRPMLFHTDFRFVGIGCGCHSRNVLMDVCPHPKRLYMLRSVQSKH